MNEQISRFLDDLDSSLASVAGERRLDLYHIGKSALVWKYEFVGATEDIDVITSPVGGPLLDEAVRLFGKGTPKATSLGLYLDVVSEGLPPVPGGFRHRAEEVFGNWSVIRVFHLEPNDLAATKLKRFAVKDRQDVREMCDEGLLDPEVLQQRLESAFMFVHEKDEDPNRENAFAHLRIVQTVSPGRCVDKVKLGRCTKQPSILIRSA